jgi:hypothetical protein
MTISYVLNIKLSDKFNTKFFYSRLTFFLQIDTKDVLSLFISNMVTQTNLYF